MTTCGKYICYCIPCSILDENSSSSIKMFDRNFGRSLLAGYSHRYLSDFVLHGTQESDFKERLNLDLHMASEV